MKNRFFPFLKPALLTVILAGSLVLGGCSSSGGSTGTGGSTAAGSGGSTGGGTGGSSGGGTGGGTGATLCDTATPNTDANCTSDGSRSGNLCTRNCCLTCGIDQAGAKVCECGGGVYTDCTCSPPVWIPPGLMGGPCMPQGSSSASAADTLRGKPCTRANAVCFTSDSTASSGRGCICKADDMTMHCGSTNNWFAMTTTPTPY
jgi:hypothetical protein